MHNWGDDWEHWDELYEAIDFCRDNWLRFGRLGCHGKEKFGTFRHHVEFYGAHWAIHELVNPAYYAHMWPKLFKLDIFLGNIVRTLRLHIPIIKYQQFIYNVVLQRACKKFPNVIDELISDSDYPELIKGDVDGKVLCSKFWKINF